LTNGHAFWANASAFDSVVDLYNVCNEIVKTLY
jgi:hypothetical protein